MQAAPLGDRESDVVLRDGSSVHLRPVRPDDASRIGTLYRELSTESRVLRFFSAAVDLDAAADREARLGGAYSLGLVATTGTDERLVGQASFVGDADPCAEVAFAIAEEYQGRGLGTLLLGQLAEVAAARGIQTFEALVLPANHRMLGVFRQSGFPVEVAPSPDGLRLTFPTSLTAEARERFEQREQLAAVQALQ